MRFHTRLVLCTAVPAALFATALVASLWGLQRTQREFDHVITTEQKIAAGFNEMYAQGLQMGQAQRNILLDPGNPKAQQNFDAARVAYDAAFESTTRVTRGTPFEAELAELARLRAVQAAAQTKVLDIAKSDVIAAAASLNHDETPAWRALRGGLLKQIEASRAVSDATHTATRLNARTSTAWSVALAMLAVVAAGALGWVMQRTLRRELGGDPAQVREALRRVAGGDLSFQVSLDQANGQSLLGELHRMQQNLRRLVGEVRTATESITTASSEIASGNLDLSTRTEQAAASLQQTASSMEELTGTVQQTADAARQAHQMAASASSIAGRGGEVVASVISTMDEINSSSKKIGDIIAVIDGIAFQTNILALNAAVEAARAGDQGRGFAVVAGEVRSLAQRSAEAAKEIKSLIGISVERVDTGSRLVRDAGTTMADIVASVRSVSQVIGEISLAATEQNDGIGQVNTAVTQLDRMTQQNAALVEESAAAAGSLQEQAHKLSDVVGIFKLPTERAEATAA